MPEWSNGAVSKTVERFRVPRVRIPFSPLNVTKWQKNVILSFLFPLAHNLILFLSKADAIS